MLRERLKTMGMFPKIPDMAEIQKQLDAKFGELINEIRLVQQAVREQTAVLNDIRAQKGPQ